MEESARKVALKAAANLKESSVNQNPFEPTWTGSHETARVANAPNKMASSSSLLANLQRKRMQIAASSACPSGPTSSHEERETVTNQRSMMSRIRKFIKRNTSSNGGPTTREILNEFKDIPDSEAAVFRSLLKSIATVKNGRWALILT